MPLNRRRVLNAYGSLPLSFEPNEGQTDSSVRYVSRGPDYALFLTKSAAILSLQEPDEAATDPLLAKMDARSRKKFEATRFYRFSPRFHRRRKAVAVRMALENASPGGDLTPLRPLPGKANYFIGRNAAAWRSGIPTYAKVERTSVYKGIDLTYYGNQGRLEFDFTVSPGADPSAIRLHFDSPAAVSMDRSGDVEVRSEKTAFTLLQPRAYQIRDGRQISIPAHFVFRGADRSVGVEVARYDRRSPLIIDPTVSYSTYVGGTATDDAYGLAVDAQGDAYIAGLTTSTNFPTYNAYQTSGNSNGVAFVTELNPTGTAVLYSTYLGGTGGDWGTGIALDASGGVYVTGSTRSTDFPLVNAFQSSLGSGNGNAFVARIDTTQNGTASLVYSTYLGGGGNASNWYGDVGFGIAADSSGLAYVTGQTASDNSTAPFPTTSTALQSSLASTNGNAFLTVLDTTSSGASSLVYSTYLGGSSGNFGDLGNVRRD